ncbi:MAG: hypothetical protein CFH10_01434 [Alphaproteobacteria bacterium MarineAlpha4_Bin2]|nr:MAG: hypothetical protein CFH10_01434 [Alphaproteobacteria bacterium MarineAlpha4_Bin2]
MTDIPPILVIKLGALGDFVQALGPFAAIRKRHHRNRLVLLTTEPYIPIAEASGYFDEIRSSGRPDWSQLGERRALRNWLRALAPARVYDLQTSTRSSKYFKFFQSPRPEWSGIAPGCSHPHTNPGRNEMHTIERQREQLAAAGITSTPEPDLKWLDAETARFNLPKHYVLLAAGAAAHRPEKRWPGFAELAAAFNGRGLVPVLLGTNLERNITSRICKVCPQALDLTGETSLLEIAGLARRASGAVGNDTGPMHLIAATGCPSLVLYSSASEPALCAQRGAHVRLLRKPCLAALTLEEVEAQLALR